METGTAVSRPLGKLNSPKQDNLKFHMKINSIIKCIHKITTATIY